MAVVHATLCSECRRWKKVSTSVGKSFKRREKKLQRVRVVTLRATAGGTVVLRWTCYDGGRVVLRFCCGDFFFYNQYKQYCYNRHNDLMQPARVATGGIFRRSSKARCWIDHHTGLAHTHGPTNGTHKAHGIGSRTRAHEHNPTPSRSVAPAGRIHACGLQVMRPLAGRQMSLDSNQVWAYAYPSGAILTGWTHACGDG